MSMIGNLIRLTESQLQDILKDSSLLYSHIDNIDLNDSSVANGNGSGGKSLCIEKCWDGILYLLTGNPLSDIEHPLAKVLFSGNLIDEDQDLGYGPAHYLMPSEVKTLSKTIANISTEELKGRYNPEQMTVLGVYPEIWMKAKDQGFHELNYSFKELQVFYNSAAENNEAIIVYLD